MTIQKLNQLMQSGQFHHATYRNQGTLWEGLHIYTRAGDGCRGFTHAGVFLKNDAELPQAEEILRGTGISVGAYGQG